jgi:hypothetical protein
MAVDSAIQELEYDQSIAPVMPVTWKGHARITILEEFDLTPKQRRLAIKTAEHLLEEKDGYDPKDVGRKMARKAEEKY